mgnify:CR=1 FL=1
MDLILSVKLYYFVLFVLYPEFLIMGDISSTNNSRFILSFYLRAKEKKSNSFSFSIIKKCQHFVDKVKKYIIRMTRPVIITDGIPQASRSGSGEKIHAEIKGKLSVRLVKKLLRGKLYSLRFYDLL